MITKLVAQQKQKSTTPLSQIISNQRYMIYIQDNKKVIKIRHLYISTILQTITSYDDRIKKATLTNLNYLIVWMQNNGLQILKVNQVDQKIILSPIKAWNKKDLRSIYAKNDTLVAVRQQKVQIIKIYNEDVQIYKIENIANIKNVYIGNNIYLYQSDTILQYGLNKVENTYDIIKQYSKRSNLLNFFVIQARLRNIFVELYREKLQFYNQKSNSIQKYTFKGQIKDISIVNNIIYLITNQNSQYLHLFLINPAVLEENTGKDQIIYKYEIYQRTNVGQSWIIFNILKTDLPNYFKRKGTGKIESLTTISQNTFSILYILNAADKTKIDLFKVDHAKILGKQMKLIPQISSQGHINQTQTKIARKQLQVTNKIIQTKQRPPVKVQFNATFLNSIQKMIDNKLSGITSKILSIQERVKNLQIKLSSNNISNNYTSSFDKQLKGLFQEKLFPQLQNYFSQIFIQLGRVFQHGIDYYNQKLRTQTEIQKNTFKQLLNHTFKATNQILSICKQQFVNSVKIEKIVESCQAKKIQILQRTNQLLQKVKSGPFSYQTSEKSKNKQQKTERQDKEKKKQQKIYEKKFHKADLT